MKSGGKESSWGSGGGGWAVEGVGDWYWRQFSYPDFLHSSRNDPVKNGSDTWRRQQLPALTGENLAPLSHTFCLGSQSTWTPSTHQQHPTKENRLSFQQWIELCYTRRSQKADNLLAKGRRAKWKRMGEAFMNLSSSLSCALLFCSSLSRGMMKPKSNGSW